MVAAMKKIFLLAAILVTAAPALAGARQLGVGEIMAAAQAQYPQAQGSRISFPRKPGGAFAVL